MRDAKATSGRRKSRGIGVSGVVAVLVLLVGVGILAYPSVSNWWNDLHQSHALDSYIKAVDATDPARIEKMLADAESYNAALANNSARFHMTEAERAYYESLLDVDGTGIMGYVTVPALRIRYPIYHGTSEEVLQVAIGHIEGTSLPVGGTGSHAAVSGHRGLPSAKLFSDLDDLQPGDTFTVTVLNRTMTYEVDQIRIVTPEDVEDLVLDPAGDLMTLVTCTPYAINSHRLLVRGHRVADAGDDGPHGNATMLPAYMVAIGVGLPLLLVWLVVGALRDRHANGVPNREDAREAIRFLHRQRKEAEHDQGNTERRQ